MFRRLATSSGSYSPAEDAYLRATSDTRAVQALTLRRTLGSVAWRRKQLGLTKSRTTDRTEQAA